MTPETIQLLVLLALLLAVRYTALALFLQTVRQTIRVIPPGPRLIEVHEVWWCLVPLIGLGVAIRIAGSLVPTLRMLLDENGQEYSKEWFGINVGRLWAILRALLIFLIVIVKFVFDEIFLVDSSIPILIFLSIWCLLVSSSFLMYWIQIANLGHRLSELSTPDDIQEELDFDDYSNN